MSFEQIIYNAQREEKGNEEIYRFYVQLLRNCPAAQSGDGYDKCKRELEYIFFGNNEEVEND